jgi:translocator protein
LIKGETQQDAPDWLFAPVWSVLYLAIAINMLCSWFVFGLHRPRLAFVDILLLLVSIVAFIATARRASVIASWLFAPYLAWVAFAMALNLAIVHLN